MSAKEPGTGWGTLLVLVTVLAVANVWFKPFERRDAVNLGVAPGATQAGSVTKPLVRRTPGWTRFAKATVTPGIQTLTSGAQCTTNFVFTDAAGNVYLGQVAQTLGDQPATEGWAHVIIAPSPGIPGDSGSGYVDDQG